MKRVISLTLLSLLSINLISPTKVFADEYHHDYEYNKDDFDFDDDNGGGVPVWVPIVTTIGGGVVGYLIGDDKGYKRGYKEGQMDYAEYINQQPVHQPQLQQSRVQPQSAPTESVHPLFGDYDSNLAPQSTHKKVQSSSTSYSSTHAPNTPSTNEQIQLQLKPGSQAVINLDNCRQINGIPYCQMMQK